MTKRRVKNQKRLAKLIVFTLLCSMSSFLPSTASASVITITDGTHTISDDQTENLFYLNGSNIS
ncbi:MAG: hypothetical protein IJV18_11310, partial [Acidaminococcaceae bacterium]|nr:hypothetical protein [Acidaminococcaceae bacterium]